MSVRDRQRIHERDDGRLFARGRENPRRLRIQRARDRAGGDDGAFCGRFGRGRIGLFGSLESGAGEAEDGHGFEGELSRDRLLTDPAEAERFVRATQVDALAVAIGTSHGAYKFSRKPDGDILALEVVREIHRPAAESAFGDARIFERAGRFARDY